MSCLSMNNYFILQSYVFVKFISLANLLINFWLIADRDDVDALWQVDVSMMDVLFTSLVDYLQLENAYNIFILNPKHEKRARYGYR